MADARARIEGTLRRFTVTVLLAGLVAITLSGCLLVPVPFPAGGGHGHGHRHHHERGW